MYNHITDFIMAWRQKVIDKNVHINVNSLISDLLTSVESVISKSRSLLSINNNENRPPDEAVFKWEEISKSVEFKSARFKRKVNKTTYKINHNFGSLDRKSVV